MQNNLWSDGLHKTNRLTFEREKVTVSVNYIKYIVKIQLINMLNLLSSTGAHETYGSSQ